MTLPVVDGEPAAAPAATPAATLPVTGAPLALLSAVAVVMLSAGAALHVIARPRRQGALH